ncbi:MAG: Nitrite reductase [Planctomycetes bacterium]|nr:Nitrite reductase [Planctomycetota bacterium]
MNIPRHWLLGAFAVLSISFLVVGCGPAGNGTKGGGNEVASGGGENGHDDDDDDDKKHDWKLNDAEMERGKRIFFERCAGCHGVLRKGATGKNIEPESTRAKGTAYLEAIITNGSPAGMPEWGKSGILTPDEVKLMAKYIQNPVPPPPEWGLPDIRNSHKVFVPVEKRPTAPQTTRNWENYFGVVLRDAGKVAIIDGDNYELVNIVDTGFAVHILRTSATGRYFFSIGRDGKVTLIDLWMEKPDRVAELRPVLEARSIETSRFEGFIDKFAIVGGYWPPALVVMDGQTLEPLKMVSSSGYEVNEGSYVREARVAAIVADHHHPTWVVNIKETGQMWLVDYSNLKGKEGSLKIDIIEAERYLHDGGWDLSKRYFLVAANAKHKIAVIDTQTQKLVALVDSNGNTPHPGRGANIDHPAYGPLWATGHIGSNHISFIGTDPDGHANNAWKVVKQVELPGVGGGNLFIKTHPNSKHVYADRPLNPDKMLADSIFVIDKDTLENKKTLVIPEEFRGHKAVHMEYNKAGTEVWVAAWGRKDQKGAILVYDDKTLELKKVITGDWMVTPTGHFNVYNTVHDIY